MLSAIASSVKEQNNSAQSGRPKQLVQRSTGLQDRPLDPLQCRATIATRLHNGLGVEGWPRSKQTFISPSPPSLEIDVDNGHTSSPSFANRRPSA